MPRRFARAVCSFVMPALTSVVVLLPAHAAFAQLAEKKELTLAAAQAGATGLRPSA